VAVQFEVRLISEFDEHCRIAERTHSGRNHSAASSRIGRTVTPADASRARAAATIVGAPGVSPWKQTLWASTLILVPSQAITLRLHTRSTACAAASAGSVNN